MRDFCKTCNTILYMCWFWMKNVHWGFKDINLMENLLFNIVGLDEDFDDEREMVDDKWADIFVKGRGDGYRSLSY